MKKKIIVTNDDGITAPGIRALVEVAAEFGEVIVVAPDSPRSGQGHALTIIDPIHVKESKIFGDIESYECSGTPVDCVKIAKGVILKDQKIDLCVSGINHGSNASINILYSGTMSAAMEASIEGIQSIGFSLDDFAHDADFTASKAIARKIIKSVLENGIAGGNLLNVNIPKIPLDQIKGIKVCAQGEGNWLEDYKKNEDPRGRVYYWLAGAFKNEDKRKSSDLWALNQGYVSVVPTGHDLTLYNAIKENQNLEKL